MLIRSFRNEAEASAYAEVHKPLRTVLQQKAFTVDPAYARQYGDKVVSAAAKCWAAAVVGDTVGLRRNSFLLSLWGNPPVPRQA